MSAFFAVIIFWGTVIFGGKFAWRQWRRWCNDWPIRFISEIKNVEYFRQLSAIQWEALVLRALRTHEFQLLDDPFLGRSEKQGYAWKGGKKIVVVFHLGRPLTPGDLDDISKALRKVRA